MKRNHSSTGLAIIVLSLLIAIGGCSTSTAVVTGETRPEISPDQVKIYSSPPLLYGEIAILEANSKQSMEFSDQGKIDAAIERLKEQAAKLGANGVLINEISDGYGGSFSLGLGTGSYSGSGGASVGAGTSTAATYKVVTGIAIIVIEEAEETTEVTDEVIEETDAATAE
jgi:hypothetical protein